MKSKKKGFTLVELLAVIVVLGVVLVLVAPTALSAFYKARGTLSEMEQGIVIDAAKIYLTDLDKGKKTYILPEDISGDEYTKAHKKGDAIKGYDLKVYVILKGGIEVDIKTLVEGGYYDEICKYDEKTGEPSEGCRIKGECKLLVSFDYSKSPDGVYYVTNGYNAEILNGGCTK